MNSGWNPAGPGTGMALAAGAAAWGAATGPLSPNQRLWFLGLSVLFVWATLAIEVFHGAIVPAGKWVLDGHEEEGD